MRSNKFYINLQIKYKLKLKNKQNRCRHNN